jgi:hypothetical protein
MDLANQLLHCFQNDTIHTGVISPMLPKLLFKKRKLKLNTVIIKLLLNESIE